MISLWSISNVKQRFTETICRIFSLKQPSWLFLYGPMINWDKVLDELTSMKHFSSKRNIFLALKTVSEFSKKNQHQLTMSRCFLENETIIKDYLFLPSVSFESTEISTTIFPVFFIELIVRKSFSMAQLFFVEAWDFLSDDSWKKDYLDSSRSQIRRCIRLKKKSKVKNRKFCFLTSNPKFLWVSRFQLQDRKLFLLVSEDFARIREPAPDLKNVNFYWNKETNRNATKNLSVRWDFDKFQEKLFPRLCFVLTNCQLRLEKLWESARRFF